MKKLILLIAGLSILVSACSKEDAITPENMQMSVSNIPTAVQSTVNKSYPSSQVAYSVIQPNSLYVADVTSISTSAQVVVSNKGEIKEAFTKIAQTELPSAVLIYLESTYKGYVFVHASKKTVGTPIAYRVEITSNQVNVSLLFDENGAFIALMPSKKGGKGGHTPAITQIALSDLPASIQTALTGYVFKRAMAMQDKSGATIYHVHAEKDGKTWDLDFSASGALLASKEIAQNSAVVTKADITVLPAQIITYLNANAVGWTLKNAVAVSADNAVIHYHVLVNIGTTVQTYMFDKGFNLITHPGKGPKDNSPLPSFTVVDLSKDQIPAAIVTYLTTNYAGWVFLKAQKISADTTIKEYEIFISLGDKKYKVEFDANGIFSGAKRL